MDTRIVTVALPTPIYQTANQVAQATGQSLERVLEVSIAHALPPLDDVAPEQATELAALTQLDDAELWQVANSLMAEAEQAELETLAELNGERELTTAERARQLALLDIYNHLLLRKAHAYLLLARRGFRVPPQEPA